MEGAAEKVSVAPTYKERFVDNDRNVEVLPEDGEHFVRCLLRSACMGSVSSKGWQPVNCCVPVHIARRHWIPRQVRVVLVRFHFLTP